MAEREATIERYTRFAEEYLVDLNATQAALRCGYSKANAANQGCLLLKDPDVAEIIREKSLARRADAEVLRSRVLAELQRIAWEAEKESDKVAALKILVSHLGLDAPTKHEVQGLEGMTLAELMAMRGQGR